jgi:amino acid transporter
MLNESKKLGLRDSTAILIGGMVGSAIFSLSGVTIAQAGPASILSWIIAGIILIFYGLQTAELATIYPQSGGVFVFPEKALGKTEKQGKLWGWIAAWSYLFGCVGGAVFSVYYVGYYMGSGFEALAPYTTLIAVVAAIICGVFVLLNISATGKVNLGLTIGLIVTLGIFIIIAFASGNWNPANFTPFIGQGSGGNAGFLSAIPIAMLAYGAIVAVAFMVNDIKDPQKTIPKSMIIAMTITIILYVLAMVATLGLLSASFLAENPDFLYAPMVGAALANLMAVAPWIITLIVIAAVLALMTTSLVVMLLAARTFQAAAGGGLLPKGLSKVSKGGTPVNATLLTIIIVVIIAAIPDMTNFVISLGAFSNALVVAIICISVVAARKKNPGVAKFKAPGGSVVSIIVLVVLVACYMPDLIAGTGQWWAYTGIYYAIGMAIYFIANAVNSKKARIEN